MRLKDIMTTKVETVSPSVAIDGLRERMRMAGIHHLVVSHAGNVLGVVSARDLIGSRAGTVVEVMRRDPVVATPSTTVRRAANLMRGNGIGSLPVIDDRGRVVGIVTVSDLLEMIGRGIEKGRRTTLARRGPRKRLRASALPG
jgi:acetoin utilization protein AcuB